MDDSCSSFCEWHCWGHCCSARNTQKKSLLIRVCGLVKY